MTNTIGTQLRQARDKKSLTLEQIEQAIHIRVHFLQALEANSFEILPSHTQARGFLRLYADYLSLDSDALLEALDNPPPEGTQADTPNSLEGENASQTQSKTESPDVAIFSHIGQQLRRQRDLLGLSLEDVERHTMLRRRYLEALEAGDIDDLPSPVQGRGMLNSYASFLGLDQERLLLRFAEGLQARLAVRQSTTLSQTKKPRKRPRLQLPGNLRRIFSAEAILVSLTVVFLAIFVVWAALRIFDLQSAQETPPTAPSIAEVLLTTPTPGITATPPTPSLTPAIIAPAIEQITTEATNSADALPTSSAGVQVYVTVRQRTWMRVLVDEKIEFEGRVLPGSAYQYAGNDRVEILAGNGAALQIFFNQQDYGTMGIFGEVVDRIYTLNGIYTPTPTVTMTPSVTPRPTRTPIGE